VRIAFPLISVLALAFGLTNAGGAPPTEPTAREREAPDSRAELERAQLEQGLIRAERTARMLDELERHAPRPKAPGEGRP